MQNVVEEWRTEFASRITNFMKGKRFMIRFWMIIVVLGGAQIAATAESPKTLTVRTVVESTYAWDEVIWTVEFSKTGDGAPIREAEEVGHQILQYFFGISSSVREFLAEVIPMDEEVLKDYLKETEDRVDSLCFKGASYYGSRVAKGKVVVRLYATKGSLKKNYAEKFKQVMRPLAKKGWTIRSFLKPSSQGFSTYFQEMHDSAEQTGQRMVTAKARENGWLIGTRIAFERGKKLIQPLVLGEDFIGFRGVVVDSFTYDTNEVISHPCQSPSNSPEGGVNAHPE